MNPDINISVGSSVEYEDLIAEIKFGQVFGLIISQEEGPCIFEISVHSFDPKAKVDFLNSRNNDSSKFLLAELEEAIAYSKRRLTELRRNKEANE